MKQALSATDKICHRQENEKQLGSAVIGTPLGIAPNAICCIITARMRWFVKSWALLDVPQRKHVMLDDETGPIWDNGHRPREEVCSDRR